MSGCIGWTNREAAWVVAGWAFRQVFEDVVSRYPNDPEIAATLKLASEVGYLFLDSLTPGLAQRLTAAIRDTASAIESGHLRSKLEDKEYGTEKCAIQYRGALRDLILVVAVQKEA